jgi:hypothetical protein
MEHGKLGLLKKVVAALPDDMDVIVDVKGGCSVDGGCYSPEDQVHSVIITHDTVTLVIPSTCQCTKEEDGGCDHG